MTGASEKEKRIASLDAEVFSCAWLVQVGMANTSPGRHSNVLPSTTVCPVPSTARYTLLTL